jgi:hypothetical protein
MNVFSKQNIFPSQKKSLREKNEDWRKQNIDAGIAAMFLNSNMRKSIKNKRINYNLFNLILDEEDVKRACNPLNIKNLHIPNKIQHYPIMNGKINVLLGEEEKRNFEWMVRVVNDDAISDKEREIQEMVNKMLLEQLEEKEFSEEISAKRFEEFGNFVKYEFQDARERLATFILKDLEVKETLQRKFNDGFKDALIVGEEHYQADIINSRPVFKRINPNNIHIIRSGESNRTEDADIIIIDGYMSPGQIIDDYWDDLTKSEIKQIENYNLHFFGNEGFGSGIMNDLPLRMQDYIQLGMDDSLPHYAPVDEEGNIRVIKVYWKSLRKMKKITYYDQETGEEITDLFDENYVADVIKGEKEKVVWINEWWEGHKIGGSLDRCDGIYKRMRPRPIQFVSMENESICYPGIVGTTYSTNNMEAVSLVDIMKPYNYMYDILMWNVERLIANNWGKIMKLPLHEVPENWDIDKWLAFARGMNIAVTDAFKEGKKGQATGKLAGHMNQNSPVIDMEMGNSIQLYIEMLGYVENQIGIISGVTLQRQGQIDHKELVGNVERSVLQSSHVTEFWFAQHDDTKIRALTMLLETAKMAYRKSNKRVQYVMDDYSTNIFKIDGDMFTEADYGIYVTSSRKNTMLLETLKQLAHAGIQNDKMDFGTLMDIYLNDSISSIRRKIESKEKETLERQSQQFQEQQESIRMGIEQKQQSEQAERELKDLINQRDNMTKLAISTNNIDVEDNSIDVEKIRLAAEKISNDYKLKNEQIEETKRHNKATEEIQRSRPKSTNK